MTEITVTTDTVPKEWKEFLSHNSGSSIFNTLPWLHLLQKSCSFSFHCITAKEENSVVGGITLFQTNSLLFGKKLVTNPFSIYSSLLEDNAETTKKIIDKVLELALQLGVKTIELRTFDEVPQEAFADNRWKHFQNRIIPVLTLKESYEETYKNYKRQFKTNLQKQKSVIADSPDFFIGETKEPADIKAFHGVLLKLYRDKHHAFPHPFSFFENLIATLPNGSFRFYVAKHKEKVVAGIFVLIYRDKAYYFWSAADDNYNHLGISSVLLDKIIQDFHECGVKSFDLGVTNPGNDNLLFFKTRWGSTVTKPHFYHLSLVGSEYKDLGAEGTPGLCRRLLRFIPLPIYAFITDRLHKHLT